MTDIKSEIWTFMIFCLLIIIILSLCIRYNNIFSTRVYTRNRIQNSDYTPSVIIQTDISSFV
jgi:hypothetical protein